MRHVLSVWWHIRKQNYLGICPSVCRSMCLCVSCKYKSVYISPEFCFLQSRSIPSDNSINVYSSFFLSGWSDLLKLDRFNVPFDIFFSSVQFINTNKQTKQKKTFQKRCVFSRHFTLFSLSFEFQREKKSTQNILQFFLHFFIPPWIFSFLKFINKPVIPLRLNFFFYVLSIISILSLISM